MTEYRATPEQWGHVEFQSSNAAWASTVLELRARIEQLEEDSLEQSKSYLFCVDALVRRIEKLEAER
jgi:hypothetical protein